MEARHSRMEARHSRMEARRPSREERWPWQWIGLVGGGLIGACDGALMASLGAEMQLAGRDVSLGVYGFFAVTYMGLGFVVGNLVKARARARSDSATIACQLDALEKAQREVVHQEKLAALGRLAAGVAHEVRNPLGVIRASAAMVQESFRTDEDPYTACEFICEEIDRLNSLIQALLSLSRPAELRRELASLDKVIDRAADLAREDLRRRGIELERTSEVVPREVSIDPSLVAQVVYGLIANAADELGEGGRIEIRVAYERAGARIEVADDGPGVPVEVASQIFEPFFTSKANGTGLGLPMAVRIAEAHGGRLALVTGGGAGEGGRGACFRLELPCDAGRGVGVGRGR